MTCLHELTINIWIDSRTHFNVMYYFIIQTMINIFFDFAYFFSERHADWLQFNHFTATIREALEKLNDLVDESDPDLDLPNIIHAFQAAERARAEFPEHDWLHLTALIHDLGKVMAFFDEPQWAVVGDTFPVGCDWSENIVYRTDSFKGNPDGDNPKYK